MEKKEGQWFSDRLYKVQELLNDARIAGQEEFTIEYICQVAGIHDVNEIKKAFVDHIEPSEELKRKITKAFGLSEKWMLYGQGDYPFSPNHSNENINLYDPMNLLLQEDLSHIRAFHIVVGKYEGRIHILVMRNHSDYDYEIYGHPYEFFSGVGATGRNHIIQLYRFIRDAKRLHKLNDIAYHANEEEFRNLFLGNISPMSAFSMDSMPFFIDDLIELSDRIRAVLEKTDMLDIIKVMELICDGINEADRINEEEDREKISLGCSAYMDEKQNQIEYRESSINTVNTDKVYKIFVSSTYIDLKEHRQKVIDAILRMQNLPVGMEMFDASSDDQWKSITDTIDDSDYYILIVGKRYGSIMEKGENVGKSYTECEFRYAMDHHIPYMGFLISDDATIISSDVESDPQKMGQLKEFRELVERHGTVNYWRNADELAAQVRSSLESEIKKHPRNGWIKPRLP